MKLPPITQVGDVLVSPDILTEHFCCDLDACQGICCVEGESGAPLRLDEVAALEAALPEVEGDLSPAARAEIEHNGVATIDGDGDLVTSIVGGRDCVFVVPNTDGRAAGLPRGCALCALEGRCKPISCALYPIREKRLAGGLVGLNYHRWSVCEAARRKGRTLKLPVYRFLKGPLVRRFGEAWYDELEHTVTELRKHRMLD